LFSAGPVCTHFWYPGAIGHRNRKRPSRNFGSSIKSVITFFDSPPNARRAASTSAAAPTARAASATATRACFEAPPSAAAFSAAPATASACARAPAKSSAAKRARIAS
jgi:hypothetical protein